MFIQFEGLTINMDQLLYIRAEEPQFAWENGHIYATFNGCHDEVCLYMGGDVSSKYAHLISIMAGTDVEK